LLAAYFLSRDNDRKKNSAAITVPAVVGLKQDEAVRRLNARGLVPDLTSRPSRFPPRTVFAQDPGAGTQVDRDSHVSLSVSAAAETSVPNVVGTKTAAAVGRLKAAGLRSQVTSVPAKAAAGTVVAESPAAGTSVAKDSTVSLNVSKGQATVPNVVGQPASSAKAALRAAGLVPAEFKVPGAEPKGTVTAQKPVANQRAPRGSKVRLAVSLGPSATTTAVPDVVGQDQQTATSKLQDAGFRVQVITVPPPDPNQSGRVVDEQPAGGTRAPDGSTVTIYVGSS